MHVVGWCTQDASCQAGAVTGMHMRLVCVNQHDTLVAAANTFHCIAFEVNQSE